jgi:hypothetical protein
MLFELKTGLLAMVFFQCTFRLEPKQLLPFVLPLVILASGTKENPAISSYCDL